MSSLSKLRSSAGLALSLLALISFFNYFDRVLISVLAAPISAEFHLSDTQIGLLSGPAFIVIYVITSVAAGLLADRWHRRRIIGIALALWSVMTALCGVAQTFGHLLVARLGVGVGEGGVNPPAISMISDYYPPTRRGVPMSLFHGIGVLGIAGSFIVGGFAAADYGWRSAFFLAGAPGVVLALFFLLLVREPIRGQFDDGPVVQYRLGESFAILRSNKAFVWLTLSTAFGTYASLGILQWLPIFFVRTHQLDLKQIGLLFGPAIAFGLMAGQIVGGFITDRLARQSLARPLIWGVVANCLVILLYLAVLWVPATNVALVMTFFAAAVGASWAPCFLSGLQNACEPRLRGTAMALSNVCQGAIAQAIVPFAVGFSSDAMRPIFGDASLQVAITGGLFSNLCAAGAFFMARRAMAHRLAVRHASVREVQTTVD
ncbi:MFS transporter [Sphingobium sp. JS3065]|uniref:spinster family MFS transporter n=1 Tax=Sphingobium sp. JS3065 TaxID=2970925 RepID=UPI0022644174|nr:MFS transporter [Sphingobium sp. JS3065]UZW56381.1 MFS transporter [Sphingobium sp. JS3065]